MKNHVATCLAIGLLVLLPARAQPADTTVSTVEEVARFVEARAVAADPSGRLYVADAGRDVVVVLDGHGRRAAMLGGPGTGEGSFDEPSDVDPTNGLILLVADAGNGRIQRFSRDFLFLEALPVGGTSEGEGSVVSSFLPRTNDVVGGGDGFPIAVVSSETQEIYAIDARRHHVLHWDRNRRRVGSIGLDGPGRLVEPIALALDERSLYVADRGRGGVVVFDHFGGFVRVLAEGRLPEVQAVSWLGDRLAVVLPERILWYDGSGRLDRTVAVQLGEPLIDVARSGDILYLLTPTRLVRTRAF